MAPPVLTAPLPGHPRGWHSPEGTAGPWLSNHLVLSSNYCFATWKIIKVLGLLRSLGGAERGEAKSQAEQISNPLLRAFRLPWHFNPLSISSCRDKGAEILGGGVGASGHVSPAGAGPSGGALGWVVSRTQQPTAPCPQALLTQVPQRVVKPS